jgi:hypothetical protein
VRRALVVLTLALTACAQKVSVNGRSVCRDLARLAKTAGDSSAVRVAYVSDDLGGVVRCGSVLDGIVEVRR